MVFLAAGILVFRIQVPSNEGLTLVASLLTGIGLGATVAPALFVAGFALRATNLQRVFAIVELLRAVAAFMIAPIFAHFALNVSGGLNEGVGIALWIGFALAILGGVDPGGPLLARRRPAGERRTSRPSSPARSPPTTRRRCSPGCDSSGRERRGYRDRRSTLMSDAQTPPSDHRRRRALPRGRPGDLRLRRLRPGGLRDRAGGPPARPRPRGPGRLRLAARRRRLRPDQRPQAPRRRRQRGRGGGAGNRRSTAPSWPTRRASRPSALTVEAAPTWKGLVEVAEDHKCGLIVIGSHQRHGLLGHLAGSVAAATVSHFESSCWSSTARELPERARRLHGRPGRPRPGADDLAGGPCFGTAGDKKAGRMRTSVVASMGTTFTHRDEVRAAPPASRPPGCLGDAVQRVAQLLKRS